MSEVPSPAVTQPNPPPIVIQQMPPQPFWTRRLFVRLLMIAFVFMLIYCIRLNSEYARYFNHDQAPAERFHSGEKTAESKIALIEVKGTIMPPLTGHLFAAIKRAKEDNNVKGVLLVVDSPGGLVADSDQIYRKLVDLRKTKPIFVSMKRIAASGGVYVAMGCGEEGKIFAEPTTWTGSIGVIIPRYDASKLAEKIGVSADALKTGEFKDSLDPLKSLSDKERKLWGRILDDSLQRFTKIVADNRKGIDNEQVKGLATGQIFTAEEAKSNGLVDEIGDEDVAIEALKTKLDVKAARVVEYDFPTTFMDLLWGVADSRNPETQFRKTLEMSVPRAMYFFGNAPALAPLWQAVVE